MEQQDIGETSDGFHTFNELYEHRHALYLAVCKLAVNAGCTVWRSKFHADGSMYDGWFILGIHIRPSEQITYHLPLRFWDRCDVAETRERAPEYDGHSSAVVIQRLKAWFG